MMGMPYRRLRGSLPMMALSHRGPPARGARAQPEMRFSTRSITSAMTLRV